MSHAPLPPGTPGLPLLGETLAYMKNGFDFVETRIARHGMVFRTSLLGQPVAVLCGPDATEAFMDPARVKRENAMPANVAMLFAGKVLPVLDGAEHRERKGYVLAAFTPEAMNEGFPLVRTLARQALGDIVDREVGLVDVVKTLSLKSICEYMYGAIPDAALAQLEHDYDVITRAGAALPISLPGTTFTKGKQALARILASYRERIAEHRATPRPDGLTRLLAQRGSDGQRTIGDDEASRELHHIVIAGLIIWCWGATAIRQLASDQGLRDALRAEANALPADYDAAAVSHLPLLDRFTMETQRITPILPQVFGRAATTFEFKGYQIPEGWMLLWAWHETHMRPEVYSDPARFDPARFDAPRREDQKCPHAFAPQGAGDVRQTHKCVGYELAPLMFKAFIVELVRGYEMTLSPGQDLNLDRTTMPPGPRDGLKATLTRRA